MIEPFLDSPTAFAVADAGDSYRRLQVLDAPELEAWEFARRSTLASAPGLVTIADGRELTGFAVIHARTADSDALGCAIGAIEAIGVRRGVTGEPADRLDELLRRTAREAAQPFRLLTALVDLDHPTILDALQRVGAQVCGANTTWTRAVAMPPDAVTPSGDAQDLDTGELLDAVADAYGTYRSHYHADRRLAEADCTSVYVEAVRRHVEGGGECSVVRDGEGVIAFATLEPHHELNRVTARAAMAEIGIAGVVPRARGRGVLGIVLRDALDRLQAAGYEHAYYGCAADNFAAQSALVALGGFRPRRFCLRLHWWLDE